MTEEEVKNKEKRKNTPLAKEEYLTFFFFPYIKTPNKLYKGFTKNFNESEDTRFIKHGFETKATQAQSARVLGLIFYAILLFIFIYYW